jgi:HK97 family phage portal protein
VSWVDRLLGRRRTKLSIDDPNGWDLGTSSAGKSVHPNNAMQLATAWSCVRLLSETVGTLPIAIYRRSADGSKEAIPEHPLYRLLHDSPNADQTAAEFWEAKVAGLCLWGNGYAEKRFAGARLTSLEEMRPDCTGVRRDNNGARVYDFNDRGRTETLPEEKVFHLRGFGVGGDAGLSPISYARETLGTAMAAEEAAGKLMANGLQQPLVIDSGKARLDREQRKDLTALFSKFAGSSNAGKVIVLEQGMKPVSLAFNPDDAQLLETRAFHVEEICRWFRVPPFMIGHTEKTTSWGTGLEQQMIGFLTFSLRPYLARIEQAAKKQLLSPADRAAGVYIEFSIEGLLRADSAARADYLSKKLQNGSLMPNEWRALDNQPPVPGGDQLFVNSTLVPMDRAGQVRTQPAAGEPV